MDFKNILTSWQKSKIDQLINSITKADVERALSKETRDIEDFIALISPVAANYIEEMAKESNRLTRWHFGRTIGLYTPIYISNICAADCVYCGYSARSGNKEKRITLTPDQIRQECDVLSKQGFDNVLLLSGEAPNIVKPDYIIEAVKIAREYFSSVSIEVYSMDYADYKKLFEAGVEGVTLYMETYDEELYSKVHLAGQKRDYLYRLNAIENAGLAGMRKLSIGFLIGLGNWQYEAVWLILHALYLQKKCWQSNISLSFPRLRHTPERFKIPELVNDRQFVQLVLASRLILPEAGFNLSTRETPYLRDHLIPLGITMMSAGSSTRPGGHTCFKEETLEQFEIEDRRALSDIQAVIKKAGYDPVLKDFDHAFDKID